jgi:hypothetical protein
VIILDYTSTILIRFKFKFKFPSRSRKQLPATSLFRCRHKCLHNYLRSHVACCAWSYLPSDFLQLNPDGDSAGRVLAGVEVRLAQAGAHIDEHGVGAHLALVHHEVNHLHEEEEEKEEEEEGRCT